MKRILIITIFIPIIAVAQNQNSFWIFGDSAGISFTNPNNPIPFVSSMDGRGSCASISDSTGNLLFYVFNTMGQTDYGTYIRNYSNDTIQNGNNLAGQALYNMMVVLPRPGNVNQYFVFHLGLLTLYGLYYSVVDMAQDNGYGAVIQKNIQLNNLRPGDCLTAVKHGNGRDWWVISKLSTGSIVSQLNRFLIYLVTADSVYAPIVQDINDARDADFQKVVWHPSGNKFMQINIGGYMSEFDFDRCNGSISLSRNIFPEQTGPFNRLFWEGAYSPSGDVFYVSTDDLPNIPVAYLLQLDLNAVNIPSSIDTLDSFQGYIGTGAVRLAPDNKIYFSRACQWGFPGFPYPDSVRNYINENLSVINSPDSIGTACNYQPFSFYLGGKRTYYGLPNNPNYDLGPLVGSLCDTLTVGIFNNEQGISNTELTIFYHPSWQTAFINAQHLKGKQAILIVYNLQGQAIHKTTGDCYKGYFTYDLVMKGLANGMYIVNLQTEKESLVRKFVKQ